MSINGSLFPIKYNAFDFIRPNISQASPASYPNLSNTQFLGQEQFILSSHIPNVSLMFGTEDKKNTAPLSQERRNQIINKLKDNTSLSQIEKDLKVSSWSVRNIAHQLKFFSVQEVIEGNPQLRPEHITKARTLVQQSKTLKVIQEQTPLTDKEVRTLRTNLNANIVRNNPKVASRRTNVNRQSEDTVLQLSNPMSQLMDGLAKLTTATQALAHSKPTESDSIPKTQNPFLDSSKPKRKKASMKKDNITVSESDSEMDKRNKKKLYVRPYKPLIPLKETPTSMAEGLCDRLIHESIVEHPKLANEALKIDYQAIRASILSSYPNEMFGDIDIWERAKTLRINVLTAKREAAKSIETDLKQLAERQTENQENQKEIRELEKAHSELLEDKAGFPKLPPRPHFILQSREKDALAEAATVTKHKRSLRVPFQTKGAPKPRARFYKYSDSDSSYHE